MYYDSYKDLYNEENLLLFLAVSKDSDRVPNLKK